MASHRRAPAGLRAPLVVAVLVLLTTIGLVAACTATTGPTGPSVSPDTVRSIDLGDGWTWQKQADRLELGVTHTQESLDEDEPADARDRGTQVLADSGSAWQNQHLMGFGTLNPEASPGQYDWRSLDARMQLIRDTGGRTVLTACCSPDWMKGGDPGQTDWSRIEDAPLPGNYQAFADLTAMAVQRYPQIERVQVWNELKGFFSAELNRWDYEGYTELYNKVYTAVKAVRPDVQVGGPYMSITSVVPGSVFAAPELAGPWGAADHRTLDVVRYWLQHNVGADFLVIDGPSAIQATNQKPESVAVGAQKFADVTSWIRQQSPLPIWWGEFYSDVPQGVTAGPAAPASTVSTLAAVAAMARSGTSVALLWGPQGIDSLKFSSLWTSSSNPDGGRPTPLVDAWKWLAPRLQAGDVEIGTSASKPLLAFRAPDGAVVVNLTGDAVEVAAGHDPLPGWATVVVTP